MTARSKIQKKYSAAFTISFRGFDIFIQHISGEEKNEAKQQKRKQNGKSCRTGSGADAKLGEKAYCLISLFPSLAFSAIMRADE